MAKRRFGARGKTKGGERRAGAECIRRILSGRRVPVLPVGTSLHAMTAERTAAILPARAPARALATSAALRDAWRAFWVSRLLVWGVGMFAVLQIGRKPSWVRFDPAGLTVPFGGLGNLLVAPGARWDSVWYLAIAKDGYVDHNRTAFFPLYPLLADAAGLVFRSALVGGLVVSGACFLAALSALHRLAALELGEAVARPAVLLVAFFPMSFFFSAVYSESLFLACSVGAFLAARNERWAWAGVLGGLAAATRSSGVLLLLPLAWMYGRRLRPDVLWLALIPIGLGAYLGYLASIGIDWMTPFHVQEAWMRHFSGPLVGVWDGARAAWDGLRQLLSGSRTPVFFHAAGGDPFQVAAQNIMLFTFLVLALVALVGALRRLPFAYGLYAGTALVLPLSYPVSAQPLMSLPRYVAVLFPLHLWAAAWTHERGRVQEALAGGAVLLGLFTAQFAVWSFVA
jgi:Mannosyltransferase (PIG-V)